MNSVNETQLFKTEGREGNNQLAWICELNLLMTPVAKKTGKGTDFYFSCKKSPLRVSFSEYARGQASQ